MSEYIITEDKRKRLGLVTNRILKEIKPTEEEMRYVKSIANEVMVRIREAAPKNVEIILAGSLARGTQLLGNHDIDIFLLFPKSMKKETVEKRGLEIGKKVIKKNKGEHCVIKYAEHPYVQLIMKDKNMTVDIVPAFKISSPSERGTAVDRTQMHNKFVMSNITENQKDDVRLLKSLLLGHNIYGAEARIESFSGYLCELIIIHYGSFLNAIEKLANIKLPYVISFRNEGDTRDIIKRFESEFVVIDPTDSNRNVAANVSKESLSRLILSSRKLIKDPTTQNFYGIKYSNDRSSKRISEISKRFGIVPYIIHIRTPDISEDIVWQQLKRLNLAMEEMLKKNGFSPVISLQNLEGTDAIIGYFFNRHTISAATRKGPSILMVDDAERFIKSHSKAASFYLDADRIVAIEVSKYSTPEEILRDIIKKDILPFPSHLKKSNASLHVKNINERIAKMLYDAYMTKMLF